MYHSMHEELEFKKMEKINCVLIAILVTILSVIMVIFIVSGLVVGESIVNENTVEYAHGALAGNWILEKK